MSDFLESDVLHRVRGSVLESATSLEFHLNDALAAALSRDINASDELAAGVLPRLPVDVRMDMLGRKMKDSGADELWPLLVPVLKRAFNLRNRYAHGHISSTRDGGVRITSWNRGQASVAEYGPEQLMWLAYEAHIASTDLARLWAFWVPVDPKWHEP